MSNVSFTCNHKDLLDLAFIVHSCSTVSPSWKCWYPLWFYEITFYKLAPYESISWIHLTIQASALLECKSRRSLNLAPQSSAAFMPPYSAFLWQTFPKTCTTSKLMKLNHQIYCHAERMQLLTVSKLSQPACSLQFTKPVTRKFQSVSSVARVRGQPRKVPIEARSAPSLASSTARILYTRHYHTMNYGNGTGSGLSGGSSGSAPPSNGALGSESAKAEAAFWESVRISDPRTVCCDVAYAYKSISHAY